MNAKSVGSTAIAFYTRFVLKQNVLVYFNKIFIIHMLNYFHKNENYEKTIPNRLFSRYFFKICRQLTSNSLSTPQLS